MNSAGPLAHPVESVVLRHDALEHPEHRLVQRHVDLLGLAARHVPQVDRSQRTQGAEHAGDVVGERDRREHRGQLGVARDVGVAAETGGRRTETGALAVRTGLPEPADPHHDQPRVGLAEPVQAEAPTGERAGAEVLYEDVPRGQQSAEDVLAPRPVQVQGDPALVAGGGGPGQRLVALEGLHPAQRVAPAGHLDLDHVGPQIAQQRGSERTGVHRRRVDHPQPAQGSCGHWATSCAAW